MTDVHGTCDERFAAVRQQMVDHLASGADVGASVAVTVGGELVVDLWGGHRDAAATLPWERDTIVNVYSTTKTMSFLCALMLIDRGQLDPDAPVAEYWPEFAAGGKEDVRVWHLADHAAGLSRFDRPMTPEDLADWDLCVETLAAQTPAWEPGTATGYHAVTQGYLLGELVRRIDGRTIGTFFAEEVAGPLDADFHIGTPAEADARCGELIPPTGGLADAMGEVDPLVVESLGNPVLTALEPRETWWRRAEIPAAGGFGNARAVARIHAALANDGVADGVRLLSPETIRLVHTERIAGVDKVMQMPVRFGFGFGLPVPELPISPNERAGFWGGWGGSLALHDADAGLTVAYVMNRMEANLAGDLRGGAFVLATYGALAG